MRGILGVICLLLPALVVIDASAAVEPPASCAFDPAVSPSGALTIDAPDAGYVVADQTVDSTGRIYAIGLPASASGQFVDRVWRFRADGSLDTEWATDGRLDLDAVVDGGHRSLAVDDLGRLWVVRNEADNLRLLRRFTNQGTVDATAAVIQWSTSAESAFTSGVMAADGEGVVLAHVSTPGNVTFARVDGDGEFDSVTRAVAGGTPVLHAVTPRGYVGGAVVASDGAQFPLLWNGAEGQASPAFVGQREGMVTSMVDAAATTTVVGSFDAASGATTSAFTADLGATTPTWFAGGADGLIETVLDGSDLLPVGVFADGSVVAHLGAFDGTLAQGRIGGGGVIALGSATVDATRPDLPAAAVTTSDGRRLMVRSGSADGSIAVVGLTPELGPAVESGALDDQIGRLYEAYFLRPADAGGLSFWRSERLGGRSLEDISSAFAGSPEFIDRYGQVSDAVFVDLIYTNVLGRLGDDEGRAFWTSQLTTGAQSRGSVMLEFSESDENIDRTGTIAAHDAESGAVFRLFRAYFGRNPDAGGSCFWVRRLAGGASLDDVSDAFAASPEFAETYGALTDREFVELVYTNVLGRAGEDDGIEFWTSELEADRRTRGQVMVGFSESAEFVERTNTLPND